MLMRLISSLIISPLLVNLDEGVMLAVGTVIGIVVIESIFSVTALKGDSKAMFDSSGPAPMDLA